MPTVKYKLSPQTISTNSRSTLSISNWLCMKLIFFEIAGNLGLQLWGFYFEIDGMDALAVKQACMFAKEHALKNGPLILEMDTYRYHGHSMSDPGSTYRTRDEISGVRQDIEKEKRKEVDDAIAKAKESPMPDPSELYTNVYVKGYGVEVVGWRPMRKNTLATSLKNMSYMLKKLGEANPDLKFDIGDFCATVTTDQDANGTPTTQGGTGILYF